MPSPPAEARGRRMRRPYEGSFVRRGEAGLASLFPDALLRKGRRMRRPYEGSFVRRGEAGLASLFPDALLRKGRRMRRPYEGSFFCRGEACSPLFAHSRCVRGDACVAPTKVPSSVGAEACLASLCTFTLREGRRLR